MITAEYAKRITRRSIEVGNFMACTEGQIMRAATEGDSYMIRGLPDKPEDAQYLKKTLIELGYRVDESETLNGAFKPGFLIRVSWD
jgi:hypothetical protein